MARTATTRPPVGDSAADAAFAAVAISAAVLFGAVWAGAAVAAGLHGHRLFATTADTATAAAGLPHHLADPASAWPPSARAALPAAWIYWTAQALVFATVGAIGLVGWRLWSPGRATDGLGVERSARFARRRDLRRLRVGQPQPGRIILGRVHRTLVATEPRTSVCIVGPSQSGKTSGLCVPALLELDERGGAVIAASVKGDLWSATHRRRESLGEVKVFDPTRVLVERSATWSPLRAAGTVTGAQAAARALVDVAGRGGLDNADFWMASAKELLWPLLHVAARTGATMRDVVRWVTTHDRPQKLPNGRLAREGEVAERLRQVKQRLEQRDARRRGQPALFTTSDDDGPAPPTGALGDLVLAENALRGIWDTDERTRSSIYTTARTVIEAWSDPVVAAAADGCEITPEWLLQANNTLYIVAPAREQDRLRPVFACMVADLVHAAFDTAARSESGELATKLLVLLDEAANICPVRELPAWCSTCPSHGITLLTVWQDRSQQRLRYGREGAETVWNNSGAKVVLSGLADAATAEVTHLLGEEDFERLGSSVDAGNGRRSISQHTMTRRLVSEDALRRQQPGQGLLIYKDLPPMRLALRPWHQDRTLRALGSDQQARAEAAASL
ncbi:MAG TPA: type IV secretory system conjugative DNA transfer family protein [Acidimicrobiales bacterium]|nr:type IV secretory system conjugative DNA transfer family protein [Acidimicrobiales bacterium]